MSGDTTLEPDSDSEDPVAPPLDSLAMSQDSFQFSGDIAGMCATASCGGAANA